MKKGIIILFLLLLLSSCFSSNDANNTKNNGSKIEQTIEKKENNNIEQQNNNNDNEQIEESNNFQDDNEKKDGKISSQEEFYKIDIPEDFSIPKGDLLNFSKLIDNDKKYFEKNKEELAFFNIGRAYIFGDKTEDIELAKLVSCLDEKINPSQINNENYRNICIGKNVYNSEVDANFFHIKDILQKYKKLKNGGNLDCSYFLEDRYFYPNDKKIILKRSDYFTCKAIKEAGKYNLRKEVYYYYTANGIGKCDYLKDKNLIKLCNEEPKNNTTKVKK